MILSSLPSQANGDVMDTNLTVFEDYKIRRIYDEETETWFFSVVDIVQALTAQPDYQLARNYWKVLKNRLKKEGSQTVTKCNQLKMAAEDGRYRLTDVADAKTLLKKLAKETQE
jgi:DNA-damage-inducible protein D